MSANGPESDGLSEAELDELNKLVRAALEPDSPSETDDLPHDGDSHKGGTFGRFEGLTLVGRGGFGTVHRAYDPRHARYVALKIPSRQNAVDPAMLRRFRVEAEAVAKIDHPGVAPLYEVGEVDGLPYLASAYCEGRTLSLWRKALAKEGRAFEPEAAARIALAAARALAAAHDARVVHRDLKPSNVILQPTPGEGDVRIGDDAYRVRVIDFGLAKLFSDGDEHTRTDHHIGTPPYMAPEQFSRRFGTISTRTDVYGLGATLFAILAGRPPFHSDEPAELYAQILADPPTPLTSVRADAPRGLSAICARCLEKQPSDRYPSMRSVAEDLERFLSGRGVKARWSWLNKALLGSRRRRTLSAVAILFAAACAGWFGQRWVQHYRHERASETATAKRLADERENFEYLNAVQNAFGDVDAANPKGVRDFLERYAAKKELHHVEWTLLKGFGDSAVWTVKTDAEHVTSTAISHEPENPFVCCGLSDGRVEVRSESSGAMIATLSGHKGWVDWLEVIDSGRALASCGADGVVRVWDTRNWRLRKAWAAHDGWIAVGRASPDGRFFATCGGDKMIRIWRLPSFESDGYLQGHQSTVRDASFSHDGRYLVSGDENGELILWDFEKRSRLPLLPKPEFTEQITNRWTRHVQFFNAGPPYRIAATYFTGHVVVFRLNPGGEPTIEWKRQLDARRSSARPRGSALFFTRKDGAIARVDLSSPDAPIHVLGIGHSQDALALCACEPRGLHATGGRTGELRCWSDERDALGWTYGGFGGVAGFVGTDHVAIESVVRDLKLKVCRTSDGGLVHSFWAPRLADGSNPALPYSSLRFRDEIWRCWRTGWEVISLKSGNPVSAERHIPFAREKVGDGPLPWVRNEAHQCVSVFSQDMSREIARLPATLADLSTAYVSPDGRFVACVYHSPGATRLFELKPPHKELRLERADQFAFSATGDYLAGAVADGVVVWSTATGQPHTRVVGRGQSLRSAFVTDDGKRVLAVDRRGRLYLWDAASRALLGSVPLASNVDDARAELASDGKRLLINFDRDGFHEDSSVRVIKLDERP